MRFAWKNNARQRDKDDDDQHDGIRAASSSSANNLDGGFVGIGSAERTKMGIADGCLRFALAAEWCACKEKAMSTCR